MNTPHLIAGSAVPQPYPLVGIAADHGGFELKRFLTEKLKSMGFQVMDFGPRRLDASDDYPDFVLPLARATARGTVARGVAICGSGVGAAVAANKVPGARACLIQDGFSAHQGVEDDDLNLICLGGRVVGPALAWELVQTFLNARFSSAPRHVRRLAKVAELEQGQLSFPSALNPTAVLEPVPASRHLRRVHAQTVAEAKAEWRNEGNPN